MTLEGASRVDKDNPGPEQFYYRAHRKGAAFSPDDAWSLAIDGDSEEERGYSAFRSLPELHAYISSRKYPDLTGSMALGERVVIRFTGDEVGQGADGEPLVIPYNSDHEIIGAGSLEWHQAIGPELARIRNRLAEISGEIMRAWPRRSVSNDRASAVVGPVDRLRDELAAEFRRHHEADYSPDTYFPLRAVYEPIRPPRSARGPIRQHETLPQEYARDRGPTGHGLSPERHQAIGPELARIRNRLAEISGEIMRAWPRRSVSNDRASAVVGPVDRLRDELAAQFRGQHEGVYSPDTYYPPRAVREAPQDKPALSRAETAAQVTANTPEKATGATGQALRTSPDFRGNLDKGVARPHYETPPDDYRTKPTRIREDTVTRRPAPNDQAIRADRSRGPGSLPASRALPVVTAREQA